MKKLKARLYDIVMTLLAILLLVLLFRVAMNLHIKASSFTGEIPDYPVILAQERPTI